MKFDGTPVHVGDTLRLVVEGTPTTWHVVGLEDEIFNITAAYVTQEGYAAATGRSVGPSELLMTTTDSTTTAQDRTTDAVAGALQNRGIRTGAALPRGRYDTVVNGHMYTLLGVILAISIVIGAVGCIGLGSSMAVGVLERTRELGVMKAIGASARTVRRMVLYEAIGTALAGFLCALIPMALLTDGLRLGMSAMFQPMPFVISTPMLLLWLLIVAAGAALAALVPARRAVQLTIREALAYL
jgi:putative ABC transport system permease protein